MDIFPPEAADPVRLEFFGDEIESIRTFATGSQRSLESKDSVTLLDVGNQAQRPAVGFFTDYLSPDSRIALIEPGDLKESAKLFFDRVADATGLFDTQHAFGHLMRFPTIAVSAMPRARSRVGPFAGRIGRAVQRQRPPRADELDAVASSGAGVLIACQTDAECHRLSEVLAAGKLAESQRLQLVTGHVRHGFRLVDAGLVVLGSHEIFHKDLLPPGVKAGPGKGSSRRIESRAIDSFLDLNESDYVVHVSHGIARFRGMRMLEKVRSTTRISMIPMRPTNGRPPVEENLILSSATAYSSTFRDAVDWFSGISAGRTRNRNLKLGVCRGAAAKSRVSEAVRHGRRDDQIRRSTRPCPPLPADRPAARVRNRVPLSGTPDQMAAISKPRRTSA